MARKEIFGTDFAKDAFKTKINDNFVELYDKDSSFETQINNCVKANSIDTYISDATTFTELNKFVGVRSSGTLNVGYTTEWTYGVLVNIGYAPNTYKQYIFPSDGIKIHMLARCYVGWGNPQWSTWEKFVTTEKTEMDIPLASGFTADTATVGWKHKIIKNGDGSYDLWFAVKKTDNSNIPIGYIQIGSMVAGHIPNAFYIGNGLSVENDTSFAVGFCYVDNSRLMFHNIFASAKSLRGYIRFRVD